MLKKIIIPCKYSVLIKENLMDEVAPSEIDLKSFRKQQTLCPKIWSDDNKIKSIVRLRLLDIADDFIDWINMPWIKSEGIILTGSICNYNWSSFSDIDLHIQVEFSKVDDRIDFVQSYFDSKKNEWNDNHDGLKIYGFPVELYVEDINAQTASQGIYDLEKNDWIKYPKQHEDRSSEEDKELIKNKASHIMTKIDKICDKVAKTNDKEKLLLLNRKINGCLAKLKKMRQYGLKRGGESDPFNIVYKVIRRTNYMTKLWNASEYIYNNVNSL